MPRNVIEEIAGNLELYTDKAAFRGCRRRFRTIIGDPKIHVTFFKLHFDGMKKLQLFFWYHDAKGKEIHHQAIYTQERMLSRRVVTCFLPGALKRTPREAVLFGSVLKVAIEEFSHLIDNENMTIADLNITVQVPLYQDGREFMTGIQKVLQKIQNPKVQTLTFTGRQEEILKILPHLNPGTLRELLIQPKYSKEIKKFLRQICVLEQWKSLQSFTMSSVANYPLKYWWDIPVTHVNVRYFDLEQIHEAFEHFKESPTFISTYLSTKFKASEVLESFGSVITWNSRDNGQYAMFLGKEPNFLELHVFVYDKIIRMRRRL